MALFVMEDFVNDFEKQKAKFGLYLGEMDGWWVQVYARAQCSEWLRPRDCFESRLSQLRTGLRAAFAKPQSYYHMSCMGRTWLTNLQRFNVVVPSGCVGVAKTYY